MAMRAGTGASWSPKWSGRKAVLNPSSSARRARAARSAPSVAVWNWTPKRKRRGWAMAADPMSAGLEHVPGQLELAEVLVQLLEEVEEDAALAAPVGATRVRHHLGRGVPVDAGDVLGQLPAGGVDAGHQLFHATGGQELGVAVPRDPPAGHHGSTPELQHAEAVGDD